MWLPLAATVTVIRPWEPTGRGGRGIRCPTPRTRRGRHPGSSGGAFDAKTYRQRNTVERALNKLKNHRAVATRYDKRDYIYRGTIDAASIRIWLRDPIT